MQVALPALKSNNLAFNIFSYFDQLESQLMMRKLSRKNKLLAKQITRFDNSEPIELYIFQSTIKKIEELASMNFLQLKYNFNVRSQIFQKEDHRRLWKALASPHFKIA